MTLKNSAALAAAERLAVDLMLRHGLGRWKFAFDNARRRAGCCRYLRCAEGGTIGLSRHFVVANTAAEVRNTVLHEIAHALTRGHHHDAVWRAMCVKIGAKPVRCYNGPGAEREVIMPAGKWRATCPGCKQVFTKHRRPNPDRGRYCKNCGPTDGRITYKEHK